MHHALALIHPHLPAIHGVHGLIGAPLAVGFACLAVGVFMWVHKHHLERVTAWLFAAAAASFTMAIPALAGALDSLSATGTGTVALLVLAVFGLGGFYLQGIRSHRKSRVGGLFRRKGGAGQPGSAVELFTPVKRDNRYRRIGTPVVSIIAGAIFIAVIDTWRVLLKSAGGAAIGTLHDLMTRAHQAGAPQSATASGHHSVAGVLITAALVVAVLAWLGHKHDKRKSGRSGAQGGAGARPAMSPGGGSR